MKHMRFFAKLFFCMVMFSCLMRVSVHAALDTFTVDSTVILVNDATGKYSTFFRTIVEGDTVRMSGTIAGSDLGDLTLAIDKSGNDHYWSDAGYKPIYSKLGVVNRDATTWQMTEEQAVTFTEPGLYRIFCWNNTTPSAFIFFNVLSKKPNVVTEVMVDGNARVVGGDILTLRNETHTLTYTIGKDAATSYISIGKSDGNGGWTDISGWSGKEFSADANKKASVTLDMYDIAARAGIGNGTLRVTIYAGNGRGGVSDAYLLWIRIGWKLRADGYANGTMNFYNADNTSEEYVSGRVLFQRKPFIIKAKASAGFYLEKVLIIKRRYTGETTYEDTQIVQHDEPMQGVYQSMKLCFHDVDVNAYLTETIDEVIIKPVFMEQKRVEVHIANINRKYIDLDFWGLMVVSYTDVGTVHYGTTKEYGYTAQVEKSDAIIDLDQIKRKKVGTTTVYWRVYVDERHQIHEGSMTITVYKAPVTVTAIDQTIVYGSSIKKEHTCCHAVGVGEYHVLYSATYTTSTTAVTENGQIFPANAKFWNADHSEDVTDQYELTYVPGKLVITPKPLTPIVNADNKVYNGTTTTSGSISLSGIVGDDVVTATAASYTFAQKDAGKEIKVTANNITISGMDAASYTIAASATGKAEITARSLTPIFTANHKVYDGSTVATGAVSLSGIVSGETVICTASTITFDNKNVGNGKTVTAAGLSVNSKNYALNKTKVTATANITARSVAPVLVAEDKAYDGTTAAKGTFQLTNVVSGDSLVVTANKMVFDNKNVGKGKIVTATGLTLNNSNYVLSEDRVTASANITARKLTPILTAMNKIYDGNVTAQGTVSLSGVVSGDHVVCTAASIVFDSVHVGTGKTVTATGLSVNDANYSLAQTTVNARADISARAVMPYLTASDKVYDGSAEAFGILRVTGVLDGDTVTCAAAAIAFDDKHVGADKTVTATGLRLSNTDYALSVTSVTGNASIIAREIQAVALVENKVYDGTANAIGTVVLLNVVPGDAVSAMAYSYVFADKNVGIGRTVTAKNITLTGADSKNYTCKQTELTGVADIAKKPLTVTAINQVVSFADEILVGVEQITTTPMAEGDVVTAVELFVTLSEDGTNGTITPKACVLRDAGGVDVTANYEITYANGIVTIELTTVRGDVNCDGSVRMNDLILLLSHLSTSTPLSPQGMRNADVTEDGFVLMNDLIVLLTFLSTGNWI